VGLNPEFEGEIDGTLDFSELLFLLVGFKIFWGSSIISDSSFLIYASTLGSSSLNLEANLFLREVGTNELGLNVGLPLLSQESSSSPSGDLSLLELNMKERFKVLNRVLTKLTALVGSFFLLNRSLSPLDLSFVEIMRAMTEAACYTLSAL
jgi:hypothetical protein